MNSSVTSVIALMRPHQYVKNLFIFMPLFFVGQVNNVDLMLSALVAFVAFCLSASAVYVLNDYRDAEEDRQHPLKKHRPLASGQISVGFALVMICTLSAAGLGLMATLSMNAFAILASYLILNLAYSFKLKHIAIIDVTIISIGFVLRLFIGSCVTDISLSMWIVTMTFLLALFLALAKRRDDVLIFMDTGKKMRQVVDGYNLQFIDAAMMIMAAVVIVSYILYTTSAETVMRFGSNHLYLSGLFVILGIMRYLQITFVENNSGSPTRIALGDRFIQLTIVAWLATFGWVIYL